MNVWFIHGSDAIPDELWGYKHALTLSELLSRSGHRVLWWTVNFSHATKKFRSDGWKDIEISPSFAIRLVPVSAYKKHLSLARLWSNMLFGWRVYMRARKENPPDVIILSLPQPLADLTTTMLANSFGISMIVDFRDKWPELFAMAFPKPVRCLAPLVLWPFYLMRRVAFRRADALTAVCDSYLEDALKETSQVPRERARVIYCGADVKEFRAMMENGCTGVSPMPDKLPGEVWAMYAGTLGNNYDIPALLDAILFINQNPGEAGRRLKFFIAGDGPVRDYLKDFVAKHQLRNVVYLGVLSLPELCRYFKKMDVALSLYAGESTVAYPAKAFDYYAAGLPVVNSARGDYSRDLVEKQMGIQYQGGNSRSLAEALLRLAANDSERRQMAKNAWDAAGKYDRQAQYAQILELLNILEKEKR